MTKKEEVWQDVEEILLQHGGSEVIRQNDTIEELNTLLSEGSLFTEKAVLRPMIPSQCHYNAAQLWKDESDGTLDIMTGYALSDDGGWRQHSWLIVSQDTTLDPYIDSDGQRQPELSVSRGTIIETTVERQMYYGYKLSGEERDRFIFMNR